MEMKSGLRIMESSMLLMKFCGPRIGVAYAEEDALLPWRFL
jgi:3-methyladenine DNA glycosylase Mpg